jgi:hypothetical protein
LVNVVPTTVVAVIVVAATVDAVDAPIGVPLIDPPVMVAAALEKVVPEIDPPVITGDVNVPPLTVAPVIDPPVITEAVMV